VKMALRRAAQNAENAGSCLSVSEFFPRSAVVPLFSRFCGAHPHFCYFFCEKKVGPAGRRLSGSEPTKAKLSKKRLDKAAPQVQADRN